ncbi:MAG: OmpA family protein [Bacteroidales bacterium]|nr:OmpA family protein [Bacteroidales bacterium]
MKTVLLLAFILLLNMPSEAQEKNLTELKEYFSDAEFFFAQEEYADALYDYLELYNNGFKENANINYKMGICYLNIPGQKDKAIGHLLEAVKNVSKKYSESKLKQKSAPLDAYLFLGNAYRVNNKLNDAIQAYNKYKEVAVSAEEIKFADQQISACNTALSFMNNPLRVKLTNLGDSVNGTSSNFKGVVSGDGKTLVFMNELPFYDAVYFSKYNNGWSSPVNITPQIESDGDQYVSSISYDGTKLFLTREDAFNSDIYMSRYDNNRWTKSLPVAGQDINTKFWESHASLSKDGKSLYFTSNRKGGVGDMDIYVSKHQPDGSWGLPVNLGIPVNTSLNEDTPFITDNDSLLYYSSQGNENMGGYDIFVSSLDASGKWLKPENMKYPVNTTDDDLFYYPWNNNQVGYISKIQPDGFGKEDIYAVQPYDSKELPELLTDFFKDSEPALRELIPVETPEPGKIVEPAPIVHPEQTTVPEKPAEPAQPEKLAEPVVQQIPKEIDLDPVYFAFDNFQLNEEGKKQLDKIFQLLKDHPAVRVKFIGHADAKGPAEYNQKLSEKRANAVLKYILERGVDSARLEAKGMGEQRFAAINSNPDGSDNPEGRRLNRRVEYEITGANDIILTIRATPVPENLKFKQ